MRGVARLAAAISITALPLIPGALGATPDAIARPAGIGPGDAGRGRAIVTDRARGLCLLCHSGPFPSERFQGDLAPSLAGAGSRWSEDQLRQRITDGRALNPASIMPSYGRTEGRVRVAPALAQKPVLSPAEIEDVVAFLVTLKD